MFSTLDLGLNARGADALPSWNDGPAKQSIAEFVAKVTKPGTAIFVPPPQVAKAK
jgi:hypothetical protein